MEKTIEDLLNEIVENLTSHLLDEIDKFEKENPDLRSPDFEDYPEIDEARSIAQDLLEFLPYNILNHKI